MEGKSGEAGDEDSEEEERNEPDEPEPEVGPPLLTPVSEDQRMCLYYSWTYEDDEAEKLMSLLPVNGRFRHLIAKSISFPFYSNTWIPCLDPAYFLAACTGVCGGDTSVQHMAWLLVVWGR